VTGCPCCGREVPSGRGRWCSRECGIRGCERERSGRPIRARDREGQAPAWEKKGTRALELAGRTFGELLVVRLGVIRPREPHVWWLVRCSCGREEETRANQLVHGTKRRCRACQAAAACTSPAARAPGATRGRCSWCPRTPKKWPFECDACNRQACRAGRDATGRPIYRLPAEHPTRQSRPKPTSNAAPPQGHLGGGLTASAPSAARAAR
jgi:hypothetical protein